MFGRKKENPVEVPIVEEVVEEKNPAVDNVTRIGKGIKMIGNFESKEKIELYGTVEGKIVTDKTLDIFQTGMLKGDAAVDALSLEGTADGNIVVEQYTHIASSGVFTGRLETLNFETSTGCSFNGELHMKHAAPAVEIPEAVVEGSTQE